MLPSLTEAALALGIELSFYTFDGAGSLDANDYTAGLLVVYLRRTF